MPCARRKAGNPQWRRAPKGSRTRSSGSSSGSSPHPRNGGEPRRARGRARLRSRTLSPNRSRNGGEPRRARGPGAGGAVVGVGDGSRNGGEPRRARGPDDDRDPVRPQELPAMEASPEGLADRCGRRSGRRSPRSRNGGEPRRARGREYRLCSNVFVNARNGGEPRRARGRGPGGPTPRSSRSPQWRRAPKGSRTARTFHGL